MGLQKHYLRYGRSARDHLLGWVGRGRSGASSDAAKTGGGAAASTTIPNHRPTPLSMLISQGVRIDSTEHGGIVSWSQQEGRLAVIVIGVVTLVLGVLLTAIPWLNYFILQNLRLWNDTLSFHYWQRPEVIRLTRVYIYNVTNPDGFLMGEKPKLQEVGPFVYREDMQKVNVQFYDNFTVSYQHKKILQFVPELSVDKDTPIITPNIPLLTLTSQSTKLGYWISKAISLLSNVAKFKPFINVTADQLAFGYDDPLVSLAHTFYPRHIRPMARMGLLLGRNGTLTEISTIKTGHAGMNEFGYMDRLNGLDHLPHWNHPPCTSITGSEGSFFPPRDITEADTLYLYDKDLCRVIPLKYRKRVEKDGIDADLYSLPGNSYGDSKNNPENQCFDMNNYAPTRGLQNISPCQYGAPVFISNPHFYQADPRLLDAVDGLRPNKSLHETFFKIQPTLGVPLEGKVRIQLNLKVTHAKYIQPVSDFRDFVFPIMWLEEGISELTPAIRRWIYLATVFAPVAIPIVSYLLIITGTCIIAFSFVRAYQSYVFARNPTLDILEMGRRSLRRGSSFIAHHQLRLMHRESYTLLRTISGPPKDPREDALPIIDS